MWTSIYIEYILSLNTSVYYYIKLRFDGRQYVSNKLNKIAKHDFYLQIIFHNCTVKFT